MRTVIPPCGRQLSFDGWTTVLVERLRQILPEVVQATRRGKRVTLRYGKQTVTIIDDAGTYKVLLDPRFGGVQDRERHDDFTATNTAKTIAGHLDAQYSMSVNQRC